MFGQELAPRVRGEELAGIEPVQSGGFCDRARGLRSAEVGVVRTAHRPEGGALGDCVEAEDFLDAAIAVRRDHQDVARELARAGDAQHEVVVELSLRPVIEQLEGAESRAHLVETGSEDEGAGEGFDDGMRGHGFPGKVRPSARTFKAPPVTRSGYALAPMSKRHRPGASTASVLAHIEEIVVATSGEDAFEVVFALAAARLVGGGRHDAEAGIAHARKAHPELGIAHRRGLDAKLLARVDTLLARAMPEKDARLEVLDAVFESLVPRIGKGHKGQFFTPRPVVELVIRALAPGARDVVVDPSCGSGAFLAHARACRFGGARALRGRDRQRR